MQNRFETKKRNILKVLDTPDEEYHDLSPKGSVDEAIRPLIADINRLPGLVTTSSCSGRVSVFCEGKKKASNGSEVEDEVEVRAGTGGKGQGKWLFISHDPLKEPPNATDSNFMSMFGLRKPDFESQAQLGADSSYIHLKYEPMILHMLTASLDDSHRVLTAALSAGFRESGAVSLGTPKVGDLNPMVAVRSTGYSFDAIIGYQDERGENFSLVDETHLRILVSIANGRFKINEERIARFRSALLEQYSQDRAVNNKTSKKADWEDPEVRRQRKREEGLARQKEKAAQAAQAEGTAPTPVSHMPAVGLEELLE